LLPTKTANKHERLFWRGREGHEFMLMLFRLQMLFAALCLAINFSWLKASPQDLYFVLFAIYPVLMVMISFPKVGLPLLVISTSIEQMKKYGDVETTLTEMKTEKTLKLLKMLSTLQAQAKRAAKLQGGGAKRKKNAAPLDAAKETELRSAFDLFDGDGSGEIDSTELRGVMLSLGVDLNGVELRNLMVQMDASGDGQISFQEFCDVMGETEGGEPDPPEEVANAIFDMIDDDRSGKITHNELRSALLNLSKELTEDDIASALDMFDKGHKGHDGTITKHEFAQVIEEMHTFD